MRRRAGALAAAALLALMAGPAGAQSAAPAPDPDPPGARPAAIDERFQEMLGIGRQLDRIGTELPKVRERAAKLAARVEALKKEPQGVMRDVQLQDALKGLRAAIAEERHQRLVAANLTSALRTRRFDLARDAEAEATRLVDRARKDVEAGRDDAARARFEAAFDLLVLPVEPVGPEVSSVPSEKTEPKVDLALPPDATPDEKREMALILFDEADRTVYNAQLWVAVLVRLQAEREDLEGMLALTGPPSEARAEALARLGQRIDAVRADIGQRRAAQVGLLGQAVTLEREAALDERAMLMEAAANRPREAAP